MKVITNYLYNLIYQMLVIILPIVTIPYISRVLGADGLGQYAYTNAWVQYFILVGMLGLATYSSREIAYVREDSEKLSQTFWEINFLRFVTLGISMIAYLVIFGVVVESPYKKMYMIQSINILCSLFDISWLFIGLENFKKVVIRNTFVKLIGVILIFALVKDSSQVWLYSLILAVCQLVGQLIMWRDIPEEIKFVIPKCNNIFKHLRFSIKLFIPQIAINVYTMLDKLMLGGLSTESQVGMYDNVQRIVKVLVTVVTALATVTIPKMANLYKNKMYNEFKDNVYKSFSFVSFIACPMAFGLIGISKSFIAWFYGSGFEGILPMFYVGSFLIITLGWSSILGNQVLIATKKEKQFTISVTTGAIINLIFNFILIRRLEGLGTTISSVMAEYTGMFLMAYFLRNELDIRYLFKSTLKYLISAIIMCVVILCLSIGMADTIYSTVILTVLGGIIYISIMMVTRDKNLIYILNYMKKLLYKINIVRN